MATMVRPKGKPTKIAYKLLGRENPKKPKYNAISLEMPLINRGSTMKFWY